MRTIGNEITNEIEIKNSRFITVLIDINEKNDIQEIINNIKIKYPKATHYCYAYVGENHQKSSDDGEPGGTAGLPMLNVLLKEEIINVLAVTIRYFGGIKLGAGGLVRAYTKSVKEAINNAQLMEVEKGYRVKIKTTYDEQKNLDYLLRDYEITNKEYQENVSYEVLIPKDKLDIIKNYTHEIINEEYIKSS